MPAPNPWEAAADYFDPPELKNQADPVGWAERKGVHLWSKQREIIESVRDNYGTAVPSCHSAGKSFTAALVVSWWLDSHPPGTAFVVTSAPTGAQVKGILWREINSFHQKGNLKGRVNLTEWYINDQLVAMGRKPADHDENGFQGIHATYVLVVLDESCGIPTALWTAAYTIASNENARILAIGNPDNPTSYFHTVCQSDTWNVIRISAFDTPNLSGEKVPKALKDNLVSAAYVERAKSEWGEDSPLYISKVQGLFPTDAENTVVPHSFVVPCRILELQPDRAHPVEGGLDPAAEGIDKAVLVLRQGPVVLGKWEWPYTPNPEGLAALVEAVLIERRVKVLKIDADGLGWGVSGILNTLKDQGRHDCVSIPIKGSSPPSDPIDGDKFFNHRAEVWWAARERSRLMQWDLGALDDDDIADLVAVRYFLDDKGKIKIEKKADLKKRIGHSPDTIDALLLAFEDAVYEAIATGSTLASIDILGR